MPWILTTLAACAVGVYALGWWGGLPFAVLLAVLVMLFQDPWRDIPAAPLGVLAPVDGVVTEVTGSGPGILDREAVRVTMRINNFGAYTARSPIEGKVLDPRDNLSDHSRWLDVHGMWVRSDEDDDVVVLIHGPKWFGAPRAFLGYGERVGQGQRFAYMRLARSAEVYLPANAHVRVKPGQRVRAGTDSLAELRHR
jgi:phosphatidylserine decarboxylase